MNPSLATPTPSGPLRRFRAWAWDDPDSRSTTVGVVSVIVYFLLMVFVGPHILRMETVAVSPTYKSPTAREFQIELAPDVAVPTPEEQQKQADPFKFVEVNPDAPENTPDKTNNFGAQNQQVAQEKPTPDGVSDRPATEGRKDIQSDSIVSGQLTQPTEHVEAVPETPASQETRPPQEARPPLLARAEQIPLPGFEKREGDNPEGLGSNIADLSPTAVSIPEKIEGAPDAPPNDSPSAVMEPGLVAVQPAVDPARPRPRPSLANQPRARPAFLADNPIGTSNIGPVAYDARWSNYGTYLQKLIETVQVEWERVLMGMQIRPPGNSRVTVKFILNSEGRIAHIVNVEKSSDLAAQACMAGITNRAPYGPWTEDMKAILGEQQELTFSFFYQ